MVCDLGCWCYQCGPDQDEMQATKEYVAKI